MDDRKIPNKEKIVDGIKQVLSRRLKIESQEELAGLVLKRLRIEDKNYSLSPTRVKRIALSMPEVEVKAKTKKTVKLQRIITCPVCESKIKALMVKNLLNRKTVVGYKCTSCGYESDLEAYMPMKYSFIWKKI